MTERRQTFTELLSIMHRLRSPGGCPWDAEQTHHTLRPYMLEEAFEAVDAIERGQDADLCDELGDVLLQVVFHAELAAERGAFTIEDVVDGLAKKLVRRHPHVFADLSVDSSEQVVENWAQIKAAEKAAKADSAPAAESAGSVLDGVPRGLPALALAHRVGRKAAGAGFDWKTAAGARDKIHEELAEVGEAINVGDATEVERELGDMLLAASSYARLLKVNGEIALRDAVRRFERRFRLVELDLHQRGIDGKTADEATLAEAWNRAKSQDPE